MTQPDIWYVAYGPDKAIKTDSNGAGSTVRRLLGGEMDGPGLLGWFASIYYRADLTDLVAHELERRGKNVAWDVTMKNHDITADRVKLLKRKGYMVHSVFVDVPVEKSADRVETRYRKGVEKYREGKGMGGRFIPRSVVLAGEAAPGVSRASVTFGQLLFFIKAKLS